MNDTTPQNILYYRNFCMFCWRVMRVAKYLGIELEMRNIWDKEEYQAELVAATGRSTVPVLKITSHRDEVKWMPESADIVRYLEKKYGA